MADDNLMSQDEIERLLSEAKSSGQGAGPPTGQQSGASPRGRPTSSAPGVAVHSAPAPSAAPFAQSEGEDKKVLGQAEIDGLLAQTTAEAPRREAEPQERVASAPEEGAVAPADLEYLLNQAEQALESINSGSAGSTPPGVAAFRLEEFTGEPPSQENATLDLIRDVELDLKIELGRTNMYLEDVLRLRKGSVVPLDKLAGDPVDIYVNDRLVARGEVLVLNDNFCVRVAELIAGVNPGA